MKEELREYRQRQAALTIWRDNDQCVICYFKHLRNNRRAEIHHVYSRGRKAGDPREHYSNLMCVCRQCHPMPIQQQGASASLGWVENILEQANNTPINIRFKHPEEG